MTYRIKSILLGSLLVFCFFSPLGLAAPRLKIEPTAKQIALDQSVVLKIQLEWPQAEDPYEINPLEPKLENLTLENQNQSQETGETVSQTILYEFRPLKAGTAVIYPFEISYRKAEADPWIPMFVPGQKITIVSSVPFKATLVWMGIAAGLLGVIFGSFKLWELFRIRTAARNVQPPDPKQRIYAKAVESITTFTSANAKEKLIHWSDQLRTVIATYYDIPSKATSAEVLSFLKTRELPRGEWNEISRLFEQLTEMQFSRQDIPAHDLDQIQKTLLQYVKGKIIIGNS
ncbi:MAG: hypothetical protein PHV97_04700 [Candidatus Omnitrophica bacterium]|nr:hypothetical protein [Candidatus Omnitrophota bacterium]